jgi:hypothetical protein
MQDKGKVKQFKDDKQGLRTDPHKNHAELACQIAAFLHLKH